MKINGKRWISWGALGAAVATLLAWALWPRPELVDIVEVTHGPLIVTLDEEGETRVRERYLVSAPVAGRLLRIELEPGDRVVAGETVLATFQPREATLLDPRNRAELEAEVLSLEAELERAKHDRDRSRAELEFARRDCDRARQLAQQGILAVGQLDQAELAEKSAMEALEASEHAAEGAAHRLASARARVMDLGNPGRGGDDPISIHAPIDGVVLRRIRESESVVEAGEPLLEVGNPKDLEIVADYLSRDATRVRPGARVLVERWGGNGVLEGRVRRVEPSGFTKISALGVEEKRVNVVLDLVTPHEERTSLADGFRVETRIIVLECDDVVQVPAGSLFRHGDGWAVFAAENGRARIRPVDIGARNPTAVEIAQGLSAGDRVITHPGDMIADGVRIAPRTVPY
jgi:HlyD family secretion protein